MIEKCSTIFGHVASAAGYSHSCGASNAIEIFEQPLDMLGGPPVTILARDMRLKVFYKAVEKLRGPPVTILLRG